MRYLVSLLVVFTLLAGMCATAWADAPAAPAQPKPIKDQPAPVATAPTPAPVPAVKRVPPTLEETLNVEKQGRYLATITMANGKKMELVLEGALAPYTCANFINLAKSKFYDGLTFHRVEKGFVIQGGDPEGNGGGGPGYSINLEISPFLRHFKGALSMARAEDLDSAGSQFFILTGDAHWLDEHYAAFGWVKSGQDVADTMAKGATMKTVTVEPYAGKEPCPVLAK